jgi:hypothetical protein
MKSAISATGTSSGRAAHAGVILSVLQFVSTTSFHCRSLVY